jgi:flagellar biosynthesis anti-sigma factor FlgM
MMKVDNRVLDAYRGVAPVGAKPPAQATAPVANREGQGNAEAAKVSFSAEARALAKSAEQPIDHQKVEALKQKIDGGTFKVDAHVVAQRLLDKLA